jgi:hypothetical protein
MYVLEVCVAAFFLACAVLLRISVKPVLLCAAQLHSTDSSDTLLLCTPSVCINNSSTGC